MESVVTMSRLAPSFEATMAPHYEGLLRRLTFIVGDPEDARDLAQSAYLRAFEAWSRFDGQNPRAWLYTIGINLAIRELRRRKVRLRRSAPPDATWALDVDPDLWQAIAELDARHRAALLLNVLDGYTQAEVAQVLGVPPGTVASWLYRAKARIRERLGEV